MTTPCRFAAIADDFTGGSDLAGMLAEQDVRTVQLFGLPDPGLLPSLAGRYEAAVLCLKSRSIARDEACRLSVEALDRLAALGPAQVQFKYCSTFDSTPEGNIGPVTEALLDRMGVRFTVAVPALPVNGRTQYLGHLFVGGQLLSESPLRDHPLNPMTDANLVRWLQRQTTRRVGLVPLGAVRSGVAAVRAAMGGLEAQGVAIALVDAMGEEDLRVIAEAVAELPLVTGGSGLGMHLPGVWRGAEASPRSGAGGGSTISIAGRDAVPNGGTHRPGGPPHQTLVLSGSCSAATLGQLEELAGSGCPVVVLDPLALRREPNVEVGRLLAAAGDSLRVSGVACVRSSADAQTRQAVLAGEGGHKISAQIERAFGALARRLVEDGLVTHLLVAGGETSGAVVSALGLQAVEVTHSIDPGVPALRSLGERPLRLALKSGNFGAPDFFRKAMRLWEAA